VKFKVDENLPVEVADRLQQASYDALTVPEQHLSGSPDPEVASVCQEERRALVTLDTNFADIRAYPPDQFFGLIVLRLQRQDKPHVLEVLEHLVPMLPREPLERHLWIVEETRVRIRG
jgi:predicted nuclease of predicted toxin-antitoxin system